MARQARKTSPTGYYHVMMRGNNREGILKKEWRKVYFSELLKMVENIDVAAYCIMDNHVHIVVKGEIVDISQAIKKVNIKYAMMLNREDARIGHVFQDRFRSEEIFDDAHLLQVIRYIHNNPVKAGMVKDPRAYHWSSFGEYVNDKVFVTSREQMDFVMDFFASKPEAFVQYHYKQDHMEYLDTSEEIEHNRSQDAQTIIDGFCNARGIMGVNEIYRNPGWLEELVSELLLETKLSHRHIAKMLEISASTVHKTSLETQARK